MVTWHAYRLISLHTGAMFGRRLVFKKVTKATALTLCISVLLACGGSDSDEPRSNITPSVPSDPAPSQPVIPVPDPVPQPDPVPNPIPEPDPVPMPDPVPDPVPMPIPDPTPEPSPEEILQSKMDASRLLHQASFGPTIEDIEAVVEIGLEAWIDAQLDKPASYHLPYFRQIEAELGVDETIRGHRIEAWWNASLHGEDQLRQRIAFALSQLMVVSERGGFFDDFEGILRYYDMLVEHSFGNYRELLEDVTLSPIMGMYLSMRGNEKPNLARNIRPDENFAREVMQLFSIGLVELNMDGSTKLDANGQSIATYDQDTIQAYAKVFTGWNFAGLDENNWYAWWENYNTDSPMVAVEVYHDKSEKQLLNNVQIPANQNAYDDLTMALDSLFMHSNVPPFVSKHLITRLVTSNPSPAYIERVATVFANNGDGVRGDLAAVVKAILLDEEARSGHQELANEFGKLKEPIIKATHMWRAFDAVSPDNRIKVSWPDYFFNQAPLAAPSVFNFFLPSYTFTDQNSNTSMLAPELQIITETYATRQTNFFAYFGLWAYVGKTDDINEQEIYIDLTREANMLSDYDGLIEHLNLLLLAGGMSDTVKTILKDNLLESEGRDANQRVADLVFLIMSSPQFAVQR